MTALTHNVFIIGTGVSGLSAELALLQDDHEIALLDRGEVGSDFSLTLLFSHQAGAQSLQSAGLAWSAWPNDAYSGRSQPK